MRKKMKIRLALLILVIISIGFGFNLAAQSGAAKGKGRVVGKITDTAGNPIADVTVRFISERLQTQFEVKSKDSGSFTVTGMAGGAWNVDFIKEGYKDRKISIQVSELSYNQPIELQLEEATPARSSPTKRKNARTGPCGSRQHIKSAKRLCGSNCKI